MKTNSEDEIEFDFSIPAGLKKASYKTLKQDI